jgi:hypothetical protein
MTRMFELSSKDREITLEFTKTGKKVVIKEGEHGLEIVDEKFKEPHRYYNYSILKSAIGHVAKDYKPTNIGRFKNFKKDDYREVAIKKWISGAFSNTWAQRLSKSFRPLWGELLEKIDQRYVALDKAVWRATGPKTKYYEFFNLCTELDGFSDNYNYLDVITYIPATLFHLNMKKVESDEFDEFDVFGHYKSKTTVLNWKDYYAFGGKAYTSSNKTLMAVKWPIRFGILESLRNHKLEQPITTRLGLISLLTLTTYRNGDIFDDLRRIVVTSSPQEIKKAARLYKKLTKNNMDCRKSNDISQFWNWMNDYNSRYNGDLCGLVKRNHEYHERLARDATLRRAEQIAKDKARLAVLMAKPTVKPNWDITKLDKSIVFLDKGEKIYDESTAMKHCVSAYTEQAINGSTFLFHAERDGDKATVEIRPNPWRVIQARGPQNSRNKRDCMG